MTDTGVQTLRVQIICPDRHEIRSRDVTADELGLTIAANGSYQVRPWCLSCDRWATGSVPASDYKAKGFVAQDFQLLADNRGLLGRCSRRGCDREAVEVHHFAPIGIFGMEANDWPTAFLCVEHHTEWHRRMRVAA